MSETRCGATKPQYETGVTFVCHAPLGHSGPHRDPWFGHPISWPSSPDTDTRKPR
jgi:hypothetical protein